MSVVLQHSSSARGNTARIGHPEDFVTRGPVAVPHRECAPPHASRSGVAFVAMVPDAAWRVAQQVARHLGLGEVRDLDAVNGGLLNRGLVATTPGGRWFLKGSRYPDPEPIVREHEVAAIARRAGIPSPTPIAARDGTTATRAGNRWWATSCDDYRRRPRRHPRRPSTASVPLRSTSHVDRWQRRSMATHSQVWPTADRSSRASYQTSGPATTFPPE